MVNDIINKPLWMSFRSSNKGVIVKIKSDNHDIDDDENNDNREMLCTSVKNMNLYVLQTR